MKIGQKRYNKLFFFQKKGSFLPGVGRTDEPDTCVGAIRLHTTIVRRPRRLSKNTARLVHSQNLSNGYEICEDAPAAVVSDWIGMQIPIRFSLPTQNSEKAEKGVTI